MDEYEIDLLPCPFCGGDALLEEIGNNYTKKRSIEISCTKCHIKLISSTLRFPLSWCVYAAAESWNNRVDAKKTEE